MSDPRWIPDGENGAVLRRMLEHGDNLDLPRDIEYFFVFPGEAQARSFLDEVIAEPTLQAEVAVYENVGWQVRTVRYMRPLHSAITGLEARLTTLAEVHGGEADGWGCMQQSSLH